MEDQRRVRDVDRTVVEREPARIGLQEGHVVRIGQVTLRHRQDLGPQVGRQDAHRSFAEEPTHKVACPGTDVQHTCVALPIQEASRGPYAVPRPAGEPVEHCHLAQVDLQISGIEQLAVEELVRVATRA